MKRTNYIQSKILQIEELQRLINTWRLKNEKIVFTNGCFDILHKGHVSYLAAASDLGDRLIVGINTDASVRQQNKGEERPINEENARAYVLAGLGFIDAVVLFSNDTPYELIKTIEPDVLVKGADYDSDETDSTSKKYIVGSDIVRERNGKVVTIELINGFSTTNIVNKLKK